MTTLPPSYVLVVEPDADLAGSVLRALDWLGCRASVVPTAAQALVLAASLGFDVLVAACDPPDVPGVRLLQVLRERHPRLRAVAVCDRDADAAAARAGGFDATLVRPFGLEALRAAVIVPPTVRSAAAHDASASNV